MIRLRKERFECSGYPMWAVKIEVEGKQHKLIDFAIDDIEAERVASIAKDAIEALELDLEVSIVPEVRRVNMEDIFKGHPASVQARRTE